MKQTCLIMGMPITIEVLDVGVTLSDLEKLFAYFHSVTVIGPNIYEADRFATAAFAMGRKGIQFIERLPWFEGYMIDAQARATLTSGLERYVV